MQIIWLRPDNLTDKTDRQALVAYSNFNSNNRQVEFNANNPENDNDNARGRASEQVWFRSQVLIQVTGVLLRCLLRVLLPL